MLVKARDLLQDPDRWRHTCVVRGVEDSLKLVADLDQKRKELQASYDRLAFERSKKGSGDAQHRSLSAEIKKIGAERREVEGRLQALLESLPNWAAPDTPLGASEQENVELERHGECVKKSFCHENASLYLKEEAAIVGGSRTNIFAGDLALLELYLTQWLIEQHLAAGFEYLSLPSMVTEACMYGAGKLPKFAEEAFSSEGRWLVPTGEVPLVCLKSRYPTPDHSQRRLMACTPCFRREAGASGKDTRGWIRQHQFLKVELVILTFAEKVEESFDLLCERVASILTLLGLTWRKMRICGGDMGLAAYKQVDFEVWMAGQGRWLEVASISDCRAYQSSRLGKPEVYTLNGTGGAVGRLMAGLVEQHCSDSLITLPPPLAQKIGKDKLRI